jgi:hypothetical protein
MTSPDLAFGDLEATPPMKSKMKLGAVDVPKSKTRDHSKRERSARVVINHREGKRMLTTQSGENSWGLSLEVVKRAAHRVPDTNPVWALTQAADVVRGEIGVEMTHR